MTFFGMRKYPTPIQKPMLPFFIGGAVMFFAISSLADTLMDSPAYRNDPRNPKAQLNKDTEHH
ncbi:atp18 subunit J of the mitochondrial F1F0 ATP synthase [Savitreella phatthalungensis]